MRGRILRAESLLIIPHYQDNTNLSYYAKLYTFFTFYPWFCTYFRSHVFSRFVSVYSYIFLFSIAFLLIDRCQAEGFIKGYFVFQIIFSLSNVVLRFKKYWTKYKSTLLPFHLKQSQLIPTTYFHYQLENKPPLSEYLGLQLQLFLIIINKKIVIQRRSFHPGVYRIVAEISWALSTMFSSYKIRPARAAVGILTLVYWRLFFWVYLRVCLFVSGKGNGCKQSLAWKVLSIIYKQ